MQLGLARAWQSRVSAQAEDSEERLAADGNLARWMLFDGNYAEAEPMLRELHRRNMRMFGAEHPNTLMAAGNLAESLSRLCRYAEAKQIQRDVLGMEILVLGVDHPNTLTAAGNLAETLSRLLLPAEAERIQRDVLRARQRVLWLEYPKNLTSEGNLAMYLSEQGRYSKAENSIARCMLRKGGRSGSRAEKLCRPAATLLLASHGTANSPRRRNTTAARSMA